MRRADGRSPPGTMLPRVYLPGDHGGSLSSSELSTLHIPRIPRIPIQNVTSAEIYGVPPAPPPQEGRRKKQSFATNLTERASLVMDPRVNEAAIYRKALFENPLLGFQRLFFVFCKYPALVLSFVPTWTLWGSGMFQKRIGNEESSCIVSLCTGGFFLAAIVLFSADHNHSYTAAKFQSNLRHMCSVIGGAIAVVTAILSASTIHPLRKFSDDHPHWNDTIDNGPYFNSTTQYALPFSPTQRIAHQSVILGCSICILLLVFSALTTGLLGVFAMDKKLEKERTRARNTTAYDNPVMHF